MVKRRPRVLRLPLALMSCPIEELQPMDSRANMNRWRRLGSDRLARWLYPDKQSRRSERR